MQNNNVYDAPQAELLDESNAQALSEHYVLPQSKLWIFSILSFGIFLIPWNYMHWRRIKLLENSNIWPAPRSLFSIFFIHSLFTNFELGKQQIEAEYTWSPAANAAAFIIFSIIGNLLDQIYSAMSLEIGLEYWLLFIAALIIPILSISNAQKVANIVSNDPTGHSNSRWTIGNYLWLVICLGFWALIGLGLFYADV